MAGTLLRFGVLAIGALFLATLVGFVPSWFGRWHVIAGIALLAGSFYFVFTVAEYLMPENAHPAPSQPSTTSNRVEFVAALLGLGLAIIFGVAAYLWPADRPTVYTSAVLGVVAFFLALGSVHVLFGAVAGGLMRRSGRAEPFIKAAALGFICLLVIYGAYTSYIDGLTP